MKCKICKNRETTSIYNGITICKFCCYMIKNDKMPLGTFLYKLKEKIRMKRQYEYLVDEMVKCYPFLMKKNSRIILREEVDKVRKNAFIIYNRLYKKQYFVV